LQLISKEVHPWAWLHGVEFDDLEIEQAGGQRAFAEWFNGKLQTQCLNVY
jgi:hypothetical protein